MASHVHQHVIHIPPHSMESTFFFCKAMHDDPAAALCLRHIFSAMSPKHHKREPSCWCCALLWNSARWCSSFEPVEGSKSRSPALVNVTSAATVIYNRWETEEKRQNIPVVRLPAIQSESSQPACAVWRPWAITNVGLYFTYYSWQYDLEY